MRINDTYTAQTQVFEARQNQAAGAVGRGSNTGASSQSNDTDEVTLSGQAGVLSQALSAQSLDRANRVQALAQQYAAGDYHVDLGKLSDSLIDHALRN